MKTTEQLDMKHPWEKFEARVGYKPDQTGRSTGWDCENFPFVVRWSASTGDRLSIWRSIQREFRTLEDAVAAYKMPFRGLSVDLVCFNGKPPGQHLDLLAYRKAGKPTKWSDAVPQALQVAR